MVLPRYLSNWHDLIRDQEMAPNVQHSSFQFLNTYFFDNISEFHPSKVVYSTNKDSEIRTDDIPRDMHMLQHYFRTQPIPHLPKSIHR